MSDSKREKIVLPGAKIGMFGSGQLGRMFVIAAKRLGYQVHVFSPEPNSPAGQVADLEIVGDYDDLEAVAAFARNVEVMSLEFENIPVGTIEAACQHAPVFPGAAVLRTTQNRLTEKTFLKNAGLAVTEFAAIHSLADLQLACQTLMPAVLKTTELGYDGKGQVMLQSPDQAAAAWEKLRTDEAILEAFVDFQCEVSVVASRNLRGDFVAFPVIRNDHRNHILDVSVCPAGIDDDLERQAVSMARTVMENLDAIGVLCVEFFLSTDGKLIINEIAPRPHNSGHLTVDASTTCQFEQQVRSICNLSLGDVHLPRPAAMVNLLGDCWQGGEPNWAAALEIGGAKLHLYGKHKPVPGRKMGHITTLADTVDDAVDAAKLTRDRLLNQ